jgi:hypothetical protein
LNKAIGFLERRQLANGEFEVLACNDEAMTQSCTTDPSVFPNALIAYCLASWPRAADVVARVRGFLLTEQDTFGLWRHWTSKHPRCAFLPPDLDDTSCAATAFTDDDAEMASRRQLILANRNSEGLFHTWFAPRFRWTGLRHLRTTLAQLRHPLTLHVFFKTTAARRHDVDAVVNANALLYLGDFPDRDIVIDYLLDVLRHRRESECDKWYSNHFVIWYFFSRSLSRVSEAKEMISRRISDAVPTNAIDRAMAINALLNCGQAPPAESIARLVDAQLEDGSWPRAALYFGGRLRRGISFGPRIAPFWGSAELTTAFCIEALSRSLSGRP